MKWTDEQAEKDSATENLPKVIIVALDVPNFSPRLPVEEPQQSIS